MRRSLILLLLLPTAFAAAQQPLRNPSFEDLDASAFAAGWRIWPERSPEPGAVMVDNTHAHTGGQSLRLHHNRASSYTRGEQVVTVEPNQRYYFRAWIKGDAIEPGEASMGARLYIEGIGGRDHASERKTGTFDWQQVTIGPLASRAGGKITVMCYLHWATGTVWFDDVEVIKTTPDFEKRLSQERARQRLRADLTLARAVAEQVRDQVAIAELDRLAQEAETAELPDRLDFRAGPPYFPLHAALLATTARLNARQAPDQAPLAVWAGDPFAPFPVLGLVPKARPAALSALMGTGERDQTVLNLSNLGSEPMRLRLTVKGFGPGAPVLTLREAVHLQTDKGDLLADPLPRLPQSATGAALTLAPGLFKQLWLDFSSATAKPGKYSGSLILRGASKQPLEVPLVVEVLPVSLPATLPIVTWNYSYQHEPLIKHRWQQARADLVAHHINAYCWPAAMLPWPQFDAAGKLQPLDWSSFDAALKSHDNIRHLLLWPGFEWEDNLRLRQGLEPGSPLWQARFTAWFQALIAGLKQRGFGYDRVAWYLTDEPTTPTRVRQTVTAGMAIRSADPQALIVENPYRACPRSLLDQMRPVVDIWCAELQWAKGDLLPFFQQHSKILWTYQVLGPQAPAFDRHRLSFWECWQHGMTGQGFWAYADCGGSNWDPYDAARAGYAVVYDGDDGELIPSRRWEAWREGVEDYTYLWLLREAEGETGAAWLRQEVGEMLRQPSPEALARLRSEVLKRLAKRN